MIRSELEKSLIWRRKSHSQLFGGRITNGLQIRLVKSSYLALKTAHESDARISSPAVMRKELQSSVVRRWTRRDFSSCLHGHRTRFLSWIKPASPRCFCRARLKQTSCAVNVMFHAKLRPTHVLWVQARSVKVSMCHSDWRDANVTRPYWASVRLYCIHSHTQKLQVFVCLYTHSKMLQHINLS